MVGRATISQNLVRIQNFLMLNMILHQVLDLHVREQSLRPWSTGSVWEFPWTKQSDYIGWVFLSILKLMLFEHENLVLFITQPIAVCVVGSCALSTLGTGLVWFLFPSTTAAYKKDLESLLRQTANVNFTTLPGFPFSCRWLFITSTKRIINCTPFLSVWIMIVLKISQLKSDLCRLL